MNNKINGNREITDKDFQDQAKQLDGALLKAFSDNQQAALGAVNKVDVKDDKSASSGAKDLLSGVK